MKFKINGQAYAVAFQHLPAGDDHPRHAWLDGRQIVVSLDLTLDVAVRGLTRAFIEAYLITSGFEENRSDVPNDLELWETLLEKGVGDHEAAAALTDFLRQYESQGGDGALAELMGIGAAPDPRALNIDWGTLKGEERTAAVLRWHHARQLNDQLFAIYLEKVNARGLNPLRGDCFPRKQWNREGKFWDVSLITSIACKRRIAVSTGMYEGVSPIEWCDKDGVWHKEWLDRDNYPA